MTDARQPGSRDFFVHERGIVEPGAQIGSGTRIWAFAHVLAGAKVGRECNICDHTFIENDVTIGDRVTIKCGVQVWDGVRLEDDVFVGPNVTFTNDLFPRSKQYPQKFVETVVRRGASIGANATILAGVDIGLSAMVGAGAVVTKNVAPYAIVVGNPATVRGYVTDTPRPTVRDEQKSALDREPAATTAKIIQLPMVHDLRGDLVAGELVNQLPFQPRRMFAVSNVSSAEIRGEHAYRKRHQLLVCISGSVSVIVDDGQRRDTVVLDRPNNALHIPPLVWSSGYQFSSDAVLIVLASDAFDSGDYMRR